MKKVYIILAVAVSGSNLLGCGPKFFWEDCLSPCNRRVVSQPVQSSSENNRAQVLTQSQEELGISRQELEKELKEIQQKTTSLIDTITSKIKENK